MKITVDLNILLDVAQNRLPHYPASEEILHRARLNEYAAVLPAHALTTLNYIIEKYSGTALANQTIDGLLGASGGQNNFPARPATAGERF